MKIEVVLVQLNKQLVETVYVVDKGDYFEFRMVEILTP